MNLDRKSRTGPRFCMHSVKRRSFFFPAAGRALPSQQEQERIAFVCMQTDAFLLFYGENHVRRFQPETPVDQGLYNHNARQRRFHVRQRDVRLCHEPDGAGHLRIDSALLDLYRHVHPSAADHAHRIRRTAGPVLPEEDDLYAGLHLGGAVSADVGGPVIGVVLLPRVCRLLLYPRVDPEHIHRCL